jgi:cytochrome c oxidase subunit 2
MRIVFVVALTLATATIAGSAVRAAQVAAPTPRVIDVIAERFEFWPPAVTIDEGETVVFQLRSEDTLHGFRIVGTGTNVTVPKRGKGMATTTIAGLKPGRYTFECSRLCGAGHNFMRGVLIVRAADGSSR